jgi:hypothetical protein
MFCWLLFLSIYLSSIKMLSNQKPKTMKRILLLGFAFVLSASVIAQGIQLKKGIPTAKRITEQKVAIEPEKASGVSVVTPKPSNPKATSAIVTVLPLGTSANAYGYLSNRTYVWADDSLGIIANLHRMGPGTTPPSLSGYLAIDKAVNQGASASDWTNGYQVSSALLNNGGTYFLDANRYPQGVIFNPPGNTSLDNVYYAYLCPNLSNAGTWGGYNYGVCNWNTQTDSTKHMQWYNPPPSQYIPDGMTITHKGVIVNTDLDRNWDSGAGVYMEQCIINRATWDDVAKDMIYEQFTIPLPTTDAMYPADNKVAASPDGNIVWMVTLASNGGAVQIGDSMNYYPILQSSNDGGATWSDPLAIQMDGPNGIDGIKNGLSDYRLEQLFGTLPSRDAVPYTTAFDCDIVVDKWGNPHIGVVVGVSAGAGSIATGDSNCMVFDIYTQDDGNTWHAQKMGDLATFRGTFGASTEDNRTQISINETGDHVFLTWLDTHVEGVTDNNQPDVFARGFSLIDNKITSVLGVDISSNVTYLSDVYQQAYFGSISEYVFTITGGGHKLPIVTELLSDPGDDTKPVDFKYISDFSYMPADYTIIKQELTLNATISPNPVQDIATLTIDLKQGGNLTIEITNMVGQKVMTISKGYVNSGTQQYTIDAGNLQAGVYFCTIKLNDQKITNKMVVR